ncbi:DUF2178 domain-containing protein [Methanobrevibacter sp. OttesenSCG-928-K11]|nr:DUF2178 domain-containing protein [Methanobrevibacter sp. OttesenSCG-928-K11]MDL2270327.1 DUF2178 domain-containing protein [Methanobrevibacter sp. OttesenSCG-928-I08]
MTEEYVKNKMKYLKISIILGILLLIFANLLPILSSTFTTDEFWTSVLSCWGAIFLVFGLVRSYMIRKNPGWVEANEIAEYDERNTVIRGKAAYLTFVMSIVVLALMSTVFIYLDYLIPLYLSLGLMFGEYIIFIILTWHYGKKL